MQPVLGKLGAPLGDDYKRLGSIHAEIESLTLEIIAMDALLETMHEAEVLDLQDKAWMKELFYDSSPSRRPVHQARWVHGKVPKFAGEGQGSPRDRQCHRRSEEASQVSHRNKRHKSGEAGASNTSNLSKIDQRVLPYLRSLLVLMDPRKSSSNYLGAVSQRSNKQSWWAGQLLPTSIPRAQRRILISCFLICVTKS
jgi:hypothetical protein